MPRRSGGFTIIEMLITVGVIGAYWIVAWGHPAEARAPRNGRSLR